MEYSKLNKACIIANQKGYYVENGIVYSPSKRVLKLRLHGNYPKYHKFNIAVDGKSVIVLVHKLVAYQKYGEVMFQDKIVVRHLNDNSLDNSSENIALGTLSDNQKDRVLNRQRRNYVQTTTIP